MKIPYFNLGLQHRAVAREVGQAVARVLSSGQYVLGEENKRLEAEVAQFSGAAEAVAVANGTDAITLGLRALGVAAGDEVITSPMTFIATIESILMLGAKPVLADVDPVTYTLDPEQVKHKITRRTKVILPVHLYGQAAAMKPLLELARRHHLKILEDTAQAFGARYHGKRLGAIGDIGSISFYPTKNLGGYGDGGMILARSGSAAKFLRALRNHGATKPHHHVWVGVNSRLDEIQAAALRVKLKKLDGWNDRRRQLAQLYTRCLTPIPEVTPPVEAPGNHHIYHIYAIRVPVGRRDALRAALSEQGIGTMLYYPKPVHLQPAMKSLGYRRGSLPQAECAVNELVALPLYPELTKPQVRIVAASIQEFFS